MTFLPTEHAILVSHPENQPIPDYILPNWLGHLLLRDPVCYDSTLRERSRWYIYVPYENDLHSAKEAVRICNSLGYTTSADGLITQDEWYIAYEATSTDTNKP